ncbi:MAG: glycosyltransferase family 39 protein [Gemmatimonadaceae bacterium]
MRAFGAVLVLLVLVPAYRLLASPDAGPFILGAIDAAELSRTMLLTGTLIVVAVGVLASRILGPSSTEDFLVRLGARIAAIPPVRFALGAALISASIALGFSIFVLQGKPNLIDAMVQLLHARFFAAGHLSGPADGFSEFWQIQNSLITPRGWVSQYPPGYIIFLALGLRLGVPEVVGPFFVFVTVFFTALSAERLLRDDVATARLGVVMLALSPFLIGLAGAYMNHIGGAAFISVAMYFALLSLERHSFWWAVLTGFAVGLVFSIRPLTAVVTSLVIAVLWLGRGERIGRETIGPFLRNSVGAVIGIAPVFAALGWYNQLFFGSPFRFGYVAAQGPLTGLGFHPDPTGQMYGPIQALGYTSADLVTLSLYLLETAIPAVLLVGLFLIFARRFAWGERIIALWALLPVVGNFFYWHHGSFMGPRMLNEATPPWVLLTAVAAVGLVRLIPKNKSFGNYPPRSALVLTLLVGWLGGIFFLGPERLASYGGPWQASTRVKLPASATSSPSLVFVHGAWGGRVAMRLVAHGLRLDSLEVAMRSNTTCDVHNYSLWYASDSMRHALKPPPIDFDFRLHAEPPKLRIADGDDIRTVPGVRMPYNCLLEAASDTLGIVEVGPLLWQTDLPGSADHGAMVVRDMGPVANARLIARYPNRVPSVFYRSVKEGAPELVPYAIGMRALWPRG